ncbi:13121_t:CDS:2 [Acaulospora colombiana]|uniref:13121_t:CDS:1 n=1 Tax=Acaulospora colombiana TaxID=27376 RepID=A0ACA9MXM6_9GLOM|nr:13121_t:CDS:2 [Acaulospora colombiana]
MRLTTPLVNHKLQHQSGYRHTNNGTDRPGRKDSKLFIVLYRFKIHVTPMSPEDARFAETGVVETCSLGGDDEEEPGKIEAFEDGDEANATVAKIT